MHSRQQPPSHVAVKRPETGVEEAGVRRHDVVGGLVATHSLEGGLAKCVQVGRCQVDALAGGHQDPAIFPLGLRTMVTPFRLAAARLAGAAVADLLRPVQPVAGQLFGPAGKERPAAALEGSRAGQLMAASSSRRLGRLGLRLAMRQYLPRHGRVRFVHQPRKLGEVVPLAEIPFQTTSLDFVKMVFPHHCSC